MAAPPVAAAVVDRTALIAIGATGAFALTAAVGLIYDVVETALSGFVAMLITVLMALVAAIVHLVVARARQLPSSAKWPALASIFVTVGGAVCGYITVMIIAVGQASRGVVLPGQRVDPIVPITRMPPGANPLIDACYLTAAGAFVALGAWTLAVCARLAFSLRKKTTRS